MKKQKIMMEDKSYLKLLISSIDGVSFKSIKIDIHQGVIKIVDDEIFYDFQLNTTESAIVETDKDEVLEKVQRGFESI